MSLFQIVKIVHVNVPSYMYLIHPTMLLTSKLQSDKRCIGQIGVDSSELIAKK